MPTADCTTPAATLFDLLTDLRNELLARRDAATSPMGEGVGALTFLIAARAALALGSARRRAALRRDPRSPRMRARDRARVNLAAGARVVRDGSAVLVSSATRPGIVHRVEAGRCSCEAVGACWHIEAARLAPPAEARAERVARIFLARRLAA